MLAERTKREGHALCTALSFQLMIQNTTGPKPIQLVVPNAVSAAVAAAMRIRSPISHRELLPFFIFYLLSLVLVKGDF